MSTRSHIGIWNEDGSLDVIYCHWDGYPSYNGAVLFHHYQEPEKIRELIALGDISSLAESVKPVEGEHTFESPQEGVVVAYGRDRHEDGVDSKHFDTLEDFLREKGERFNLSADARMDEAMSAVNDSEDACLHPISDEN